MYISSAVESPLVAIFGPGNPYRYGLLRGKNFVIHSNLNCFPCDVNKKCKNNYLCLKKISPEQILKSSFLLIDEKNQPFLFEF